MVLCVVWAACATRAAPIRAPAPSAAVTAPPVPARVFVQGSLDRERSSVCVTAEGHDGVGRLLRDGVREELRDGAMRRAAVRLAGAPDRVFHDATGWHFFSARNRWRATTFLGELEQVLRLDDGLVGRGVGRALTLRRGAVEGMDVPGTVVDAAFADDHTGVAVVEPGVALLTVDGGATWRPLRVNDKAPPRQRASGRRLSNSCALGPPSTGRSTGSRCSSARCTVAQAWVSSSDECSRRPERRRMPRERSQQKLTDDLMQ